MLTSEEKNQLMDLAKAAVTAAVHHQPLPEAQAPFSPGLAQQAGAFVTLYRRHRLRGCIGLMEGFAPLAQTVVEMSEAAALRDTRFNPVRPEELEDLEIEISVLSPLRRVSRAEELVMGQDGVMVKCRGRSGVFLPQVAQETGWSRETFLSELCESKAGLPGDAWRKPECELYGFTVEILKKDQPRSREN